MSYDADKGQLTPAPASTPSQPNFMTPAQLERFKARAMTDGTYFAGGHLPDERRRADRRGRVGRAVHAPATGTTSARTRRRAPCLGRPVDELHQPDDRSRAC